MSLIPKTRYFSAAELRRARQVLKKGGVLAYATESCFGIGGLPNHPKAVREVIRLKKRGVHKGLIVVASEQGLLKNLIVPLTQEQQRVVSEYWPGPYTFLVQAKLNVLPALRGRGRKNLAVRVSAHPATVILCHALRTSLISSSANIAKQKPCRFSRQIKADFGDSVMLINGRIGRMGKPSTLIDLVSGQVLRS